MIRFVEETGSTNADLAAALRSDNPPAEGDWLVARRQTAGRGRQGREWFDGSGNFMGSTVLELREGDAPPASLGYVAALALWDTISGPDVPDSKLKLKWPNDVLLDGGKVSGILLEMVGTFVVAGIGVNLVQAPDLPDRKTACLADEDFAMSLEEFASSLGNNFQTRLHTWREFGLTPLLGEFLGRSMHSSGSVVNVHDTDGSRITGTFAGLEETDGALRLRLADGSEHVIRAGDVS